MLINVVVDKKIRIMKIACTHLMYASKAKYPDQELSKMYSIDRGAIAVLGWCYLILTEELLL